MLYLWMPEADGVWQWSRGEEWKTAATLEQVIQVLKEHQAQEAVVYFPSREVQILQQELSKEQYKKLGQDGLKYLLEEYVIVPIDQMKVFSHFQAPNQVTILGINQHAVTTMQHSLSLLPVKIVSLLPDFLILPVPTEHQTVLAHLNGRLLVRENEWAGNSIDDLGVYLDYAAKERHYKYAQLTAEQLESVSAMTTLDCLEPFNYQFCVPKKAKNHAFNVLPKAKESNGAVSGYWKACALLCVVLIAVQLSSDALRWVKLKKVADQTAVIAIDQYKSWFGANSRVTEQNIKSQFESNLRLSQSANTQALQLLSRVGPILMQHQIVANKVNYDTAILNMDLVANSSDKLQNLVQQLNQQGFKAELGAIQTQGTSVVGLVKIQ